MRILLSIGLVVIALSASAQQRDSYFSNYDDYSMFVDSRVMNRKFVELIEVLGGRDEYTSEQLHAINQRFLSIYPRDFSDSTITKQIDLGGGLKQEMRVFWNDQTGYVFFYALLHQRDQEVVVINFTLNSDVSEVLGEF